MSKRKFSIFKVYDYKGGELSSRVNLNEDSFFGELSEMFENFEGDLKEMTVEEIQKEIEKMEDDDDFYSTYAGGDGFVGELYEHKENKLKEVSISDFFPEIAKYIKENWK